MIQPGDWAEGRPVAVRVQEGTARFTVPTTGRTDRTLVVVSSLAEDATARPIRLVSRPVERAGAFEGSVVNLDGPQPLPVRDRQQGPAAPVDVLAAPASDRTFHVMTGSGDPARVESYRPLRAVLRGYGQRVQVYVDADDAAAVDEATIRDIIATFDHEVYPTAARLWGGARDVDGDGRFTVLLTSWLDGLGGGRSAVDGLFRGADLVPGLGRPFSNGCDMLYLNASLRSGPHLRTVLAHEYAHAVTFALKCLAPGNGPVAPEEEGWLDEAIAHLVEDLHGFSRSNLDHRVRAFLCCPERYQLVVRDYYQANLFRSHGHRGSTYLFLRWCADQYGPGLLTALIASDRRGTANLEAATGLAFDELYRRWSLALFLDSLRPGCGTSADGLLAGPRPAALSAGGPEDRWLAAGTTSHFAIAEGSPTGAIDVEATAPPSARLQVTAVKLPSNLPWLALSARLSADPSGRLFLHAEARLRSGGPVRLSRLSWEPLTPPPDPRGTPSPRPRGQDPAGIRDTFGSDIIAPGHPLRSRPIELTGVRSKDGPIVVTLVACDPRGRTIPAWATVAFEP